MTGARPAGLEGPRENAADEKGLLGGVRIVDMTQFLAGPYGTLALAELGADVVKVEDPDHVDDARRVGPDYLSEDVSLYFAALNWGKRSIALRLGTESGMAAMKRLIRSADVVVDNFRPGTMTRIGLTEQVMREVNPGVITCSLTGFGETGQLAEQPGYDYTIQAMAGVMSLGGEPGGPPGKAGISYVDHVGGLVAAFAIASALVHRDRCGIGRHLDLSLFDTQISMLSYLAARGLNGGELPDRLPMGAHSSLVPAQLFACSDGYLSVFVGNDRMWVRLVELLGDGRLADERFRAGSGRHRYREEVVGILESIFATQTRAYWIEVLRRGHVACGRVNSIEEALEDPLVQDRDLVATAEHDVYGSYRHVRGPVGEKGAAERRGAPCVGEHTRAVLAELGYVEREIDALLAVGAAKACDLSVARSAMVDR